MAQRVEAQSSSVGTHDHGDAPPHLVDPSGLDALPEIIQAAFLQWWGARASNLAANSRIALAHDLRSWCAWSSDPMNAARPWPVTQLDLDRWIVTAKTEQGRFRRRDKGEKMAIVSVATSRRRFWAIRTLLRAVEYTQGTLTLRDPTHGGRTDATLRTISRWADGREVPDNRFVEHLEAPPRRSHRPPLMIDAERLIAAYVARRLAELGAPATSSPRRVAQTLRLQRDWALILAARDTMARRSELSRLTWGDRRGHDAVLISNADTKLATSGSVQALGEETAAALEAWRIASGSDANGEGVPVFRRVFHDGQVSDAGLAGQAIDRIIRVLATAAGVHPPPANGRQFGAHSTRMGMALDLENAGASLQEVMAAGRWRTTDSLARYLQPAMGETSAVTTMRKNRSKRQPRAEEKRAL
jgi:hypothetical protein